MSFIKRLLGFGKKPGSRSYMIEQAKKLHGEAIQYVTERVDDNDNVVGRGGSVSVIANDLVIDTSGERLFWCPLKNVDVSWLMSGNGVIIKGPNSIDGGQERTFTVHFVYYRK